MYVYIYISEFQYNHIGAKVHGAEVQVAIGLGAELLNFSIGNTVKWYEKPINLIQHH